MAPPSNIPQVPDRLPQFDALRRRAKQQATSDSQLRQDALKRRFASIGQLNSGAAIKTARITAEEGARQAQDAQSAIDFAEQERIQNLQDERNRFLFQSGEAEKGRVFAAGEAGKQREFQKGLFDKEFEFKRDQFDFQREQFNDARDFREREFQQNLKNQKVSLALGLKNLGISTHDLNIHMEQLNSIGLDFDVDENGNLLVKRF